MKLLVEINHYPGILDKEFDITYMRLEEAGVKGNIVSASSPPGNVPLRAGLDYFAIRNLAKRYLDFDAVICTNLPAIIAGKMARKMGFAGKIIFDDYGIWPWRGYLPWGPLAVLFPTWVRANIISSKKAIDIVVTPSEFERQNAIKRYGFKPGVVLRIPYTIEDFFSPSISGKRFREKLKMDDSEFLITYAGRLNPTKGLDRLVKAFALIKDEILSKLMIVGKDQGSLREIMRLSKRLNVFKRIIYLGLLPYKKMPEVYAASDVVIIPSLYETFCFVALEAMACGRPIIASRAGSLPEVIGSAGIFCDPNPEDLAKAIKRVLFDEELTRELRMKGPKRIRELRTEAEKITQVILWGESLETAFDG